VSLQRIGINASRTRSGGGLVHLKKILENYSFDIHQFSEIHIWGHVDILDLIPENPLFIKHIAFDSKFGIAYQIFWEKFILSRELKKLHCKLLINLDAGSVCRYLPNITMSRDMLSYEKGVLKKYFFSISWLRLIALKYVQIRSLKNASKAVFLTNYARIVIEKEAKTSFNSILIPHGIDLFDVSRYEKLTFFSDNFYDVVYVSNFDFYKNQDTVINAFHILLRKYPNLRLHLVGSFSNYSYYSKCKNLANNDIRIIFHGPIDQSEIQNFLSNSDILLFASSCENMPNTLLEYMTVKKPILCSNRGPMPEVIGNWEYLFDPEDVTSIVSTMEKVIYNKNTWNELADLSFQRVQKYSWKRSSDELFNLATNILKI
jgi:glycosyltransferase involved in cell wall biosynthesis